VSAGLEEVRERARKAADKICFNASCASGTCPICLSESQLAEHLAAFAQSEREAEMERCCKDVCSFCRGIGKYEPAKRMPKWRLGFTNGMAVFQALENVTRRRSANAGPGRGRGRAMRFITLKEVGQEEVTFPIHRLLWLKPDREWTVVRLDDGSRFTVKESRKQIIAIVKRERGGGDGK